MVVGVSVCELHLPGVRSLKGKRKIIKGLIERLHHRYRISIAETAFHDLHQRAEIGIAAVGFSGFLAGNLWITLFAMLLLAIQSSFFGPAKYGMIPELVGDRDLSQANGTINMATNIAVIAGTLAAG
ncbi:MAG: DUF503 family protein, partial [Acidobacteria bacterium]|nr:DUF503 family protein [Acidobacteriota bacterium]